MSSIPKLSNQYNIITLSLFRVTVIPGLCLEVFVSEDFKQDRQFWGRVSPSSTVECSSCFSLWPWILRPVRAQRRELQFRQQKFEWMLVRTQSGLGRSTWFEEISVMIFDFVYYKAINCITAFPWALLRFSGVGMFHSVCEPTNSRWILNSCSRSQWFMATKESTDPRHLLQRVRLLFATAKVVSEVPVTAKSLVFLSHTNNWEHHKQCHGRPFWRTTAVVVFEKKPFCCRGFTSMVNRLTRVNPTQEDRHVSPGKHRNLQWTLCGVSCWWAVENICSNLNILGCVLFQLTEEKLTSCNDDTQMVCAVPQNPYSTRETQAVR